MKSMLTALALLLLPASAAIAQTAAPAPAAHVAKPIRKPAVVAAPVHAAKSPDVMELSQIVGIRQLDPATYEVDAKMPDGTPVSMHMNAFVMQDLGRQLGTFGH